MKMEGTDNDTDLLVVGLLLEKDRDIAEAHKTLQNLRAELDQSKQENEEDKNTIQDLRDLILQKDKNNREASARSQREIEDLRKALKGAQEELDTVRKTVDDKNFKILEMSEMSAAQIKSIDKAMKLKLDNEVASREEALQSLRNQLSKKKKDLVYAREEIKAKEDLLKKADLQSMEPHSSRSIVPVKHAIRMTGSEPPKKKPEIDNDNVGQAAAVAPAPQRAPEEPVQVDCITLSSDSDDDDVDANTE